MPSPSTSTTRRAWRWCCASSPAPMAASLMAIFYALRAAGSFTATRGENVLDSAAFFYDVYECADGKYVSVAPIEDKFLEEFLHRMEIDPAEMPPKMDRRRWPEAKAKVAALFQRQTRDEWWRPAQSRHG